jgi:hypothetical protein
LPTSVRGRYLGDVTFRPLFRELNRGGAVVFVHPSGLPAAPVAGLPAYVVDFLLETTRTALSMAHGGVLDLRHLKIILAHAGGFLPYAAYRVAPFVGTFVGSLPTGVALPLGVEPDPFRAVKLLRRYYFDVALSGSPSALPSLLAFATPGARPFRQCLPLCARDTGAGDDSHARRLRDARTAMPRATSSRRGALP